MEGIQNLRTPVQFLKGVGEKRGKCYEKLKISTVKDLLYHFPRGYIDYTSPVKISETELNSQAVIKATITNKFGGQNIRHGLTVFKAVANDGDDNVTIIFYNNHFAFDSLKLNEDYYFYGRITGGFMRREMNSPMVVPIGTKNLIIPNYPLTDGLTNTMVQNNVKQALGILQDMSYDFLPKSILNELSMETYQFALKNIHFPSSEALLESAKRRLSFNELLTMQLGLSLLKSQNKTLSGCKMNDAPLDEFYHSLPFELTNPQLLAISEIIADLQLDIPMNRLLQGDVGSGKTVVAAAACYFAYKNGYQSALMAPTEILATQHYHTLTSFLLPLGVKICLLTGSITPKQKTKLKAEISGGEYSVIIGTHALVQSTTEFKRLGLVITDEQHRFGVNQRASLAEKGDNPHKLVMSATPIPRTLGLIIYGDLELSILDELPKGRIKINTSAVTGSFRPRAFKFIIDHINSGEQAYIVCPMIEETDNDLIAVKTYWEKLSNGEFKGYNVGLLHGKMSANDKEQVMADFKAGIIQLLISTTVIEVGVDVPNATIILIENADRFGLSGLHQLRGRVGRGIKPSFCILMTDNATSEVKERLKIISNTNDGFKISEQDMKLRGFGDFFGERQHGLPPLKFPEMDAEILKISQETAKKIIAEDVTLSKYPELKEVIQELFNINGDNGMN